MAVIHGLFKHTIYQIIPRFAVLQLSIFKAFPITYHHFVEPPLSEVFPDILGLKDLQETRKRDTPLLKWATSSSAQLAFCPWASFC